jgi:hypothetical protein
MRRTGAARPRKHCAGAAAWAAVLVVFVLAGAASVFIIEEGVGGTQASGTYTVSASATSTNAESPGSGLELSLTLNTTDVYAGHGVAATVDEMNAIATPKNVSAAAQWPIPGLAVGPCGALNYPIGIAVLKGNYNLSNVSSSSALQIYNPGPTSCPEILTGIDSYLFQASSDDATVFGSCQPAPCFNETVNAVVAVRDYWTGSTARSFTSGVYTVVAGDEWGGVAILHFAVTGSG